MFDPARFLGFAFANADLLVEIDREGKILFATGAVGGLLNERPEKLVGQSVGRLFPPPEGSKFASFAHGLGDGDRAGPFRLRLAGGTEAHVALFRLPDNGGKISCTLARPGGRAPARETARNAETGLPARDNFLAAAAGFDGEGDTLSLVEIPELPAMCARLPAGEADKLLKTIGASFAASGARAAGRLSETRFGAVMASDQAGFAATLRKALASGGADPGAIAETLVSLKGRDLSPAQRMLALRYVAERFSCSGNAETGMDLSGAFNAMMDETLTRARSLTDTVADRAFELVYQPVIDLKTRETAHVEALARFPDGQTGETIAFAEAMGFINSFDLAVALKIVSLVEDGKADMPVAFNISGHTVATPASFGMLAGFLARKRQFAKRILIEITETAEIADLEAADAAIGALRAMGYRVGLDDFGAGAASFNYLRALAVDFVKFDRTLTEKLGATARDDALLASVLKLCRDLKVQAIAEGIESEEMARRAFEAGFDLGQGFGLGKPAAALPAKAQLPPKSSLFARRKGAREVWG